MRSIHQHQACNLVGGTVVLAGILLFFAVFGRGYSGKRILIELDGRF